MGNVSPKESKEVKLFLSLVTTQDWFVSIALKEGLTIQERFEAISLTKEQERGLTDDEKKDAINEANKSILLYYIHTKLPNILTTELIINFKNEYDSLGFDEVSPLAIAVSLPRSESSYLLTQLFLSGDLDFQYPLTPSSLSNDLTRAVRRQNDNLFGLLVNAIIQRFNLPGVIASVSKPFLESIDYGNYASLLDAKVAPYLRDIKDALPHALLHDDSAVRVLLEAKARVEPGGFRGSVQALQGKVEMDFLGRYLFMNATPDIFELMMSYYSLHQLESNNLLSWAVLNNHGIICRLLIERGASISTPNKYGRTPLMYACITGHLNILLNRYGPELNAKIVNQSDSIGMTALSHVCNGADRRLWQREHYRYHINFSKDRSTVQVLLEAGARIDMVYTKLKLAGVPLEDFDPQLNQVIPIEVAIESDMNAIVGALLDYSFEAKYSIPNDRKHKMICHLIEVHHEYCLEQLLHHPVFGYGSLSTNMAYALPENSISRPLQPFTHRAIICAKNQSRSSMPMLKVLIRFNQYLCERNYSNATTRADTLLEFIDCLDNRGNSPLMLAAHCNDFSAVKLLLEHKADVFWRNWVDDDNPMSALELTTSTTVKNLLLYHVYLDALSAVPVLSIQPILQITSHYLKYI